MRGFKKIIRAFGIGFVLAFIMQFFTMCPTDSGNNPAENPPIEETAEIKAYSDQVVNAFKSGNEQQVIALMYDEHKEAYTKDIIFTTEKMNQFASALENRKLISLNELYAEYELTIDGITFTIAYANSGDGVWKLFRF